VISVAAQATRFCSRHGWSQRTSFAEEIMPAFAPAPLALAQV
jgi:hypothetical protein